jgi:hypothetical protein
VGTFGHGVRMPARAFLPLPSGVPLEARG